MNEKMTQLIAEAVKRWGADSPQFFNVIKYVSAIIAVLLGLPAYLQEYGLELPAAWSFFVDKAMFYLGIGAGIVAKLTVENKEDLK